MDQIRIQSNSRREFVIQLSAISAVVSSGAVLTACGGSDTPPASFNFGVASGDPLADRVIIWTHAKREDNEPVELTYEVSTNAEFTAIVSSGATVANESTGFTAKVDATGLAAGRSYFYRFRQGNNFSPVGRTRTLPDSAAAQVKFAVFSCANYPAGFFNVYAQANRSGAEYALHLGDYIYEYPANGYASQNAAALGRVSDPANEILSLSDYRKRHAQYKSDPDLKTLHAGMPMIAVWDDHEIANNTFKDGAENHTEGTEGSFVARRQAALQAYHEWMPIRTGSDRAKIYRSFDFGTLLSLHMLDTRLIGRDKQITATDLFNPATQAAATATLSSPTRQLLGSEQVTWLQGRLSASQAAWQVLGQQVLMARMTFPVSILSRLDPNNVTPESAAQTQAAITAYLTAKQKQAAGLPLTATEAALLNPATNPKLGYNLDAWDGYPAAREILLSTAAQLRKNLVVLSGDTHNAWHSDLTLQNGTKVGEEFATSSVSSPGLENVLGAFAPAQTKSIFENVIDDLNWADTARRGFLLMTFTRSQAKGEWIFIDKINSRDFAVAAPASAETRIFNASTSS